MELSAVRALYGIIAHHDFNKLTSHLLLIVPASRGLLSFAFAGLTSMREETSAMGRNSVALIQPPSTTLDGTLQTACCWHTDYYVSFTESYIAKFIVYRVYIIGLRYRHDCDQLRSIAINLTTLCKYINFTLPA